eukprot:CAMPEP_0203772068 /NCGR_PEP_ID=MMETSP0099_2-20121227/3803_1 /ASSEMBLY_ACC=CAM_ASM_000209 /TAXON_ID=96639 /ORGANISM=" , Strain NY0313808BC1" /LENGTH=307 /DNA_ID=CAMNT_0050669559 /DNA_START=1841 /DNA_END=2764 /DNA_ORIENTATION=+
MPVTTSVVRAKTKTKRQRVGRRKKECEEGLECPYKHEHQHAQEYKHEFPKPHDFGKGGRKLGKGKRVAPKAKPKAKPLGGSNLAASPRARRQLALQAKPKAKPLGGSNLATSPGTRRQLVLQAALSRASASSSSSSGGTTGKRPSSTVQGGGNKKQAKRQIVVLIDYYNTVHEHPVDESEFFEAPASVFFRWFQVSSANLSRSTFTGKIFTISSMCPSRSTKSSKAAISSGVILIFLIAAPFTSSSCSSISLCDAAYITPFCGTPWDWMVTQSDLIEVEALPEGKLIVENFLNALALTPKATLYISI